MEDHSAALREIPFFAHLGPEELTLLGQQLHPRSCAAGEYIFRRGDPGGDLYLVLSGQVELFVTNNTGARLLLEKVEARGFFGEVSLFDGEARSADAVACVPTQTLRLSREDLETVFAQHPGAAFEVMAQVARRLRQANALLRHAPSPSPNQVIAEEATAFERFADWLAYVSGTLPFLLVHMAWFGIWIGVNLRAEPFDPFPFGLLTMVVSLEAIFLSCVVLISQNRQVARDRIRSDAEYEANIRAAAEITQLHSKFDHFEELVISRLDAIPPRATRNRAQG